MLIPLAIALGSGIGAWQLHKRRPPTMTLERQKQYDSVLTGKHSPEEMVSIAAVFEGEGLKAQGYLIRQRAALRAAPEEVKEKRREILRKAIKSTNVEAMKEVAKAFDSVGATGAAATIRRRIKGLEELAQAQKSSLAKRLARSNHHACIRLGSWCGNVGFHVC